MASFDGVRRDRVGTGRLQDLQPAGDADVALAKLKFPQRTDGGEANDHSFMLRGQQIRPCGYNSTGGLWKAPATCNVTVTMR